MEVLIALIVDIGTATEESNGNPSFSTGTMIVLIVGIVTAATPMVIWLLNRMGTAGEILKLNLYIKKIEIASKLKQLEKELGSPESLDWGPLKEEISEILSTISKEQKVQKSSLGHDGKKLSFLRRVFIGYKPVSIGSWILHVYFYMTVFSLIVMPIIAITSPEGQGPGVDEIWFMIPSYLLIAYLIRKWAIYLLKKNAPENKYFG